MATVPDQASVDAMFGGAATAASAPAPTVPEAPPRAPVFPDVSAPSLEELGPGATHTEVDIRMLLHLRMPVSVVLGRSKMRLADILPLGRGSVVPLNRLTGEAVEFMVGDMLLAEGEVVVANEHYAIRIGKIVAQPQDLLATALPK